MIVCSSLHQYPRRILLAIAVNSPQLVAETLYALVRQTPACVPTEIHVITTDCGKSMISKLVDGAASGEISQFCSDYPLNPPRLGVFHVHVIKDNNGRPLEDIKNREDNSYAVDFVIQTLKRLTADPDSSLITLLSDDLLNRLLEGETRFSAETKETQAVTTPPTIVLTYAAATLRCGCKNIPMKPADLAFYAWFLERRVANKRPLHWSDEGLAEEFLRVYGKLFGQYNGNYERAETALTSGMNKEYFDSRKSRTNSALKKVLAIKEQKPYLIDTFGKRPMTRFGIKVDADAIRLC